MKNRAKATNHAPKADKCSFYNQNLRKDINLLAKTSSKKKILEMYASVIKKGASQVRWQQEARKRPENFHFYLTAQRSLNSKQSITL
jgi:predicted carbohydrate-binding protein with CBM5 and CBM33 domain